MITMPRIGEQAPDFALPGDDGRQHTLSEFKGKKLVLYFYPKDDTPGCTREACDFRDNMSRLEGAGASVVGISADDKDSHLRFKGKYHLPFLLLSDEDRSILKAYGEWKEKNLYGKKTMGIERTTDLIDGQGRIAKIYHKVKVEGNVDKIMNDLRSL